MPVIPAERLAVLWVPDWSAVAAGARPDEPAAVVFANRVVAATPVARDEGVDVGVRRREAQARCPGLTVLEHDPDRDRRAFEPVIAAVAAHITPRVEVVAPGQLVFPTRGPSRYHKGDAALAAVTTDLAVAVLGVGAGPAVGVADGRFAALLAAIGAWETAPSGRVRPPEAPIPPAVIAPGGSAAFLAPLPVDALGLVGVEDELVGVLRRLGLRTLGAVAALDVGALAGRFGFAGVTVHRLAAGEDEQPATPTIPPADLTARAELDPPAEQVETVAFVARGLADELAARLDADGLACTRLLIVAETEHGERLERRWRGDGSGGAATLTAGAIADRVRWQLDGWLRGNVSGRDGSSAGAAGEPGPQLAAQGLDARGSPGSTGRRSSEPPPALEARTVELVGEHVRRQVDGWRRAGAGEQGQQPFDGEVWTGAVGRAGAGGGARRGRRFEGTVADGRSVELVGERVRRQVDGGHRASAVMEAGVAADDEVRAGRPAEVDAAAGRPRLGAVIGRGERSPVVAGDRPTAGIVLLELVPEAVVPATGRQLGFWGGAARADERVVRAVARVVGLLGVDAVRVPEWRGGRAPAEQVVLVPAIAVDLVADRPTARQARQARQPAPWPGALPAPAPAMLLDRPGGATGSAAGLATTESAAGLATTGSVATGFTTGSATTRPGVAPTPGSATAGLGGTAAAATGPITAELVDAEGAPVGVGRRGELSTDHPTRVRVGAGGPWLAVAAWAGPWPAEERWWDRDRRRRRARLQVLDETGVARLFTIEGGRWTVEAVYD